MATTPPAAHCSGGSGASAGRAASTGTGSPTRNSAGEHVESVAATGRPHERCDLAGGQVGEDVGTEPLRHRRQRVAGVVERLAGAANVLGPVEEARAPRHHRRCPAHNVKRSKAT